MNLTNIKNLIVENAIRIPPKLIDDVERVGLYMVVAAVVEDLYMFRQKSKNTGGLHADLSANMMKGLLKFQTDYLKVSGLVNFTMAGMIAWTPREISYEKIYVYCQEIFPRTLLRKVLRHSASKKNLKVLQDKRPNTRALAHYDPTSDTVTIAHGFYIRILNDLIEFFNEHLEKETLLSIDQWYNYFVGSWVNYFRSEISHELAHWVQVWIYSTLDMDIHEKESEAMAKKLAPLQAKYNEELINVMRKGMRGEDPDLSVLENIQKELNSLHYGLYVSKPYERSPYVASLVFPTNVAISKELIRNPALTENDVKTLILKRSLSDEGGLQLIKQVDVLLWKKLMKCIYVNSMKYFRDLTEPPSSK